MPLSSSPSSPSPSSPSSSSPSSPSSSRLSVTSGGRSPRARRTPRRIARAPRSPRATLIRLLSLLVAVVTALVVWRDLGTLRDRTRTLGPLVGVVVAERDLALGATVRAGDLRVVERHRSQVDATALTDPDDAVGRTVVVPILEGFPVPPRALAPSRRRGTAALVPVGHRAVRVRADDGLLPRVGDTVDVLAVIDPAFGVTATGNAEDSPGGTASNGSLGPEAAVVARGARVVAVDAPDNDANEVTRTVGTTILVTEQEARRVAFAQASGVITLALDPPEDACCGTE